MNAPDKIAEDLRERYTKCCHPDDEAYSAWECTLIERASRSEERERVLRDVVMRVKSSMEVIPWAVRPASWDCYIKEFALALATPAPEPAQPKKENVK